jgi:hypothetical protein
LGKGIAIYVVHEGLYLCLHPLYVVERPHLGVGSVPGARVRMEGVLEEGVEEVVRVRELETPKGVVVEGEGVWEGAVSRG